VNQQFDIVVIGAGIAGASIAAELAPFASVLVAEGEQFPGYHSTGRSAAFWAECYGGPGIAPLTLASGDWLRDNGFLHQRGALHLAREEEIADIWSFEEEFAGSGVTIECLGRAQIEQLVPGIRAEWTHAISEPFCADIDVGRLHQHYLASAKQAGAQFRMNCRLISAERKETGWKLGFSDGSECRSDVLVNAAGAWADAVAATAGVRGQGITPYRRTVVQLRVDPPADLDLPLVLDIKASFYFKPESGRLWLSPHDETPCEPCDAAPEEMDVAIAIDRFEKAVDWKIEALERKWAGLRSFAPDRLPVYGFDPHSDGFFWFAGQGGFGIQTAPAAARLAAQELLGRDRDAMTQAIDSAVYSPARFG
jgi:D-arginine dehydrogenase